MELDKLNEIVSNIEKELYLLDDVRERTIRVSRDILRISRIVIACIHQDKIDEAREKLRQLSKLVDDLMEMLKDYDELKKELGEEEFKKFMDFIKIKKIDEIEYEEAERMGKIISLIDEFSVPYNIDLSIARGLDYYIGTVFEIDAPKLGAEKQICGGGEYNLVPLLGGKKIPTSGFAIGFDRTLLALEAEEFKFNEKEKPVYIAYMKGMIKEAIKITKLLRKNKIKSEMDLMGRSISKSLEYANKKGMKKVIIVAPEEWEKKKIILKDMEKGEQREIDIDEILTLLVNHS